MQELDPFRPRLFLTWPWEWLCAITPRKEVLVLHGRIGRVCHSAQEVVGTGEPTADPRMRGQEVGCVLGQQLRQFTDLVDPLVDAALALERGRERSRH